MAGDGDALRIDGKPGGNVGSAQPRDDCGRILGHLDEMKLARASPAAPVVERDRIPSGTAYGLRQIQVLLVAGPAVTDHQRGMRAGTARNVGEPVDLQPR